MICTINWTRLQRVFHAAADLGPGERSGLLDRECGEDTDLRRQVESLLRLDDGNGVLTIALAEAAGQFAGAAELEEGARLGAYRVVRLLGKGGMGSVFLAERADDQFTKQVALKTIRLGSRNAETLGRFRTERQILATLEHPNIARLLDGGETADGLPYVAMEYVDGIALDEYCRAHQLSLSRKLDLFAQVCAAVQYAHRNLIVHRDLKPSNILVTTEGQVKLLDFGIGKLLDTTVRPNAVPLTMAAERLMTPEYASPEQARGEPVSTATDIYSLGVILYELLAGRRPFNFGNIPLREAERIICEQEAPPPGKFVPGLDRDLENIALMAMRKEPERRYGTVAELADDVRRWRQSLPVSARPNTWTYRSRKFARRNRWLVAALALIVLLVTGFGIGMGFLARSAKREAENSRAVADFLVSVFQNAAPAQARGKTVTARELLDTGANRIRAELKQKPVVQGILMSAIGNVYLDLGEYDKASPLLQDAVRVLRQKRGENDLDTADAMLALAGWKESIGHTSEAETLERSVLKIRQRALEKYDPKIAMAWNELGMTFFRQGHFADAEQAHRNALEIKQRSLGNDDESTRISLNNLAIALYREGKYAEAEPLMRANVEYRVRTLGEDHPSTATSLHNWSFVLGRLGRYADQENASRRALAIRLKVLGENHPETVYSWDSLASTLLRRGLLDEALTCARKAVAIRTKSLAPGAPEIALAQIVLASVLIERGEIDEADVLVKKAAQSLTGTNESIPGDIETEQALVNWARGDLRTADAYILKAIQAVERSGDDGRFDLPGILSVRAEILRASGRSSEALQVARESLKAAEFLPARHPLRADPDAIAGGVLCDAGQRGEGERLLNDALTLRSSYLPADHRLIRTVNIDLARCRQASYDAVLMAAGPSAPHWQMKYLLRRPEKQIR